MLLVCDVNASCSEAAQPGSTSPDANDPDMPPQRMRVALERTTNFELAMSYCFP